MKKNKQPDGMPVWFDGKNINEALFCEEFLQTHKIIFRSEERRVGKECRSRWSPYH